MPPDSFYRLPQVYEPFSSASHLLGALVFLYLGAVLLRRGRGDRGRVVSLGIYAVSCVLLLSMSGVYHMMSEGGMARRVMARLDHSAIFVLIAGTFTPAHIILFRGWFRWVPLAFIWACAAAGVTLKTVFFDSVPEWLGLAFYLGMGWAGGVSMVVMGRRFGVRFLRPVLLGAFAYTAGAVLEFMRWGVLVPGVVHSHELFHIAVLVGAFSHWVFIWSFADGVPGRAVRGG